VSFKILTINPGGTGIKVSVFDDGKEVLNLGVKYSVMETKALMNIADKMADEILLALKAKDFDPMKIEIVMSRGTTFYPMEFGVYPITQLMISDIKEGKVQTPHVSAVGPLIAFEIGKSLGLRCYIADPISVTQGFRQEAEITGRPEIKRKCLAHALNIRYVATDVAEKLHGKITGFNFIVCHLGTGFSICALGKENILDVNNANDGGPLSTQRAGTLPITGLARFCYEEFQKGSSFKQVESILTKQSGLLALLGTDELPVIEQRIKNGDEYAELVIKAMALQIAKEIGAMATVFKGEIDGIIFTGGCAKSDYLVKELIIPQIEWLDCDIFIIPGEGEMEALASAGLRILESKEESKEYIGWDEYEKRKNS